MGCFKSPKTPEIRIPEAPKLPTAQELFSEGRQLSQDISPLAFGAREQGLANIGQLTPTAEDFSGVNLGEISPDFYQQFQPTSFEQGVAGTAFEDMLSRSERSAGHRASIGGIESAYPELFARAMGPTISNIGQYLGNLGQQRATQAIGRQGEVANLAQRQAEQTIAGRQQGIMSQLSMDPMQMIRGYVDPALNQSQFQGNIDWQRNQAEAEANYINEMNAYNNEISFAKSMGNLFGPIAGWAYGGPEVGAGSALDIASTMASSGTGGMSNMFGQAGQGYQSMKGIGGGGVSPYQNTYGKNTPFGVKDTGAMSVF